MLWKFIFFILDMERPKLSVIVPIWGVEKYIEKCARSIFESDLVNMEIIFVDDCTPDKSIEILSLLMEEYPEREKQSQIVRHEVNKGLPQARKTGFEASHGEWIIYVDSDDWVAPGMFEKMLSAAEKEKGDVACCDFVFLSDQEVLWQPTYPKGKSSQDLRMDLLNLRISNAVWNKIVHRSIFEKNIFHFPFSSMDEDDVFTAQVAYYANKIVYVHECLYFHYANPDSMTHQKTQEKLNKSYKEQFENRSWMVNFFESKNDESLKIAITRNKAYLKVLFAKIYNQTPRNFYPEVNSYMLISKDYSFPFKVRNILMLYFYPILPFSSKTYLRLFKKKSI